MTALVKASVITDIQALLQDPAQFGALPTFDTTAAPRAPVQFASGTGNQQAQAYYASAGRVLTASAAETLTLSDGSLIDLLGNQCVFAVVHALEIRTPASNTGNIKVGAATHPFLGPNSAGFVTLTPGSGFLWLNSQAGWAIASASNDQLLVTNLSGSASNSYDVRILG